MTLTKDSLLDKLVHGENFANTSNVKSTEESTYSTILGETQSHLQVSSREAKPLRSETTRRKKSLRYVNHSPERDNHRELRSRESERSPVGGQHKKHEQYSMQQSSSGLRDITIRLAPPTEQQQLSHENSRRRDSPVSEDMLKGVYEDEENMPLYKKMQQLDISIGSKNPFLDPDILAIPTSQISSNGSSAFGAQSKLPENHSSLQAEDPKSSAAAISALSEKSDMIRRSPALTSQSSQTLRDPKEIVDSALLSVDLTFSRDKPQRSATQNPHLFSSNTRALLSQGDTVSSSGNPLPDQSPPIFDESFFDLDEQSHSRYLQQNSNCQMQQPQHSLLDDASYQQQRTLQSNQPSHYSIQPSAAPNPSNAYFGTFLSKADNSTTSRIMRSHSTRVGSSTSSQSQYVPTHSSNSGVRRSVTTTTRRPNGISSAGGRQVAPVKPLITVKTEREVAVGRPLFNEGSLLDKMHR